jgi:uncharacterized membrane protein
MITGAVLPLHQLVSLEHLRPALVDRIRHDYPHLPDDALIDQEVAQSLREGELISKNVELDLASGRTAGERLSEVLATFGGSWSFLILFALALSVWIVVNAAFGERAFDPYPYILLNLVLSCLAAVLAPIIMMSQKRQEMKDRARSLNDYRVNLKAELEIRHLHEKIVVR